MRIPLVDLKAQYAANKSEIDAAIKRVIAKTSFILGPEVSDFEQAFAAAVGAKGAVGVASGTAALHLALLALGVGPGDEVITSSHTFIATVEAIIRVGAKPAKYRCQSRNKLPMR
ncbi:MAG TPA: aminotransferase class I/II-fold pyridoxal phosphate-dependent enzyme [Pyrinomonadaceae bacterium]|nr:aminotransferase class I/II-fold pyridoxal phosphate-dependent enzyme [Pyrinomonadaceae bacterium]